MAFGGVQWLLVAYSGFQWLYVGFYVAFGGVW